MDEIALFFSSKGRIGARTFGWCVLAVYVAGFFSQALLSGKVIARAGLMPFILVQVALIWVWTALHIKRLRDANEGPAGAIGVAVIYSLAVGLLLLIVSLFTGVATPQPEQPPGTPTSPGDTLMAMFLVLLILSMLTSGDLSTFALIIKILVVIACLPALISFVFSIRTGLRPTAAAAPSPPAAAPPA
jgi:uncharacterized membrane protein YhaH (DUF805 family)